MIWRIIIWIVVLSIISILSAMLYEVIIPPITSDIAVRQVENSDEAYQALRQHDIMKNNFTIIITLVYVLATVIIWSGPIKRGVTKLRQSVSAS